MAEPTAVETAKEPGPKIVKYESLADRVDSIFQEIARRAYEIFEAMGAKMGMLWTIGRKPSASFCAPSESRSAKPSSSSKSKRKCRDSLRRNWKSAWNPDV